MTETAQGEGPAESEVASDEISIEDAAKLFKNDKVRDERGRFASNQEIEAEAEPEEGEAEAESHDGPEETDEAAEEAQPEAVDLPPSWPAELAEEWSSIPAPLQDKIVQREAEREAAVNAKFQEAANVRKANEAVIAEAQQSRLRFVEAADHVISMIQPQRPPLSMLTPGSADYNPDHYHLLNAQADQSERLLSQVQQQRQHALAQLTKEEEARAIEQMMPVEEKFRPQLIKAVPELASPQTFQAAITPIVNWAIENGIPAETFSDPNQAKWVTSPQILMAWKAMQFDKMSAAKAKVSPQAAKPTAPVVRPGVATSKSAVDATKRKNAMDRLNRSGSIADAAAVFRTLSG
jgi:hypothetical protein